MMTDTRIDSGIPDFEEVFALLNGLVGTTIDPDEPLSTAAIESLDIIEWMFLIEEETGLDLADIAMSGAGALDLETTPRDIYKWLFLGDNAASAGE